MERDQLYSRFLEVRETSRRLCQPLETEDYVIQSMVDVSPPKWNLAHTSWFFERLILQQHTADYKPYRDMYYMLFNSYYHSLGDRWRRDLRGVISRPTVKEVYAYRSEIDHRMGDLIMNVGEEDFPEVARLTELGLHHEQQHQELLVTDIKNILASNPLRPVYMKSRSVANGEVPLQERFFIPVAGGISTVGADGAEFCWDNERPAHEVILKDFSIMNRLVTCAEFLEFIRDGGYQDPLLWLSDGWEVATMQSWRAPLYWECRDGEWYLTTLGGLRKIEPAEPVAHISYYEASAFARWAGKRLPLELEWERACRLVTEPVSRGNFLENGVFHPVPLAKTDDAQGPRQMFGDVWEWTGSAYLPYPGYTPEVGPLGEYNGKFMNNQMVLRGGSCATPETHIRPTYRNFFQGDKRWQFSGMRLASDEP